MRDEARQQASQALLTLADLTPSAAPAASNRGTIPLDWFRWLPLRSVALFSSPEHGPVVQAGRIAGRQVFEEQLGPAPGTIDRDLGDRLSSIDQLRAGERTLRVGWLFVAGRVVRDGRTARVFQPLVTRPVRVRRGLGARHAVLDPAGDVEVHPGVADPVERARFEATLQLGGGGLDQVDAVSVPPATIARLPELRAYAVDLARAAGFAVSGAVAATAAPDELLRQDDLVVVIGSGVYTARPTEGTTLGVSMAGWVADALTDMWTAFHSLYVDAESPPSSPPARPEVDDATNGTTPVSPFTLTPAQRHAVVQSRSAPVTVIAGAPGTGKSHTIVAIACDALGRGETVLVGAKSDATIDALVALFERAPGPQPIVFGSSERKDALAARLADGQDEHGIATDVDRTRDALREAVAARDAVHAQIAALLRAEASLAGDDDAMAIARANFPMLFAVDADLDEIGALIAVASHGGGGWLSLRRQRAATSELDDLSGARDDARRRSFVSAFTLARNALAASHLIAAGGLDLEAQWRALAQLDAAVRDRAARWLSAESRSEDRFTRSSLNAVAALATALRSGRSARREQLRHLDGSVTRALPLWVGTLADIEDLLPRAAGLFDLVVLDEASSIDQPLATPALLRAKRAVVVGDPKQLRHVSFLSDEQRDTAFVGHGVAPGSALALKLDVRRNSAFDLAASAVPVLTLDEHFRCAPHLVDFVATHLYEGAVKVATRSPATESLDCVDIVRIDGRRDEDEVVREEIDEVIRQLQRLRADGVGSVGVITPFRAQADAIEEAVLGAFDADAIEDLGLRVGTVHSFQGNERDTMLISIGVGADGSAGSWRFVQDPHLFTVLVTRARRRLLVIVSGSEPADGLLAAYLAQQDRPSGRPRAVPSDEPWIDEIVADLVQADIAVVNGYPTGRHVLDVCVGDASHGFFGVEARIHPDGADAHIERHLSLRRAGWPLREAFPSRWGDRRGELTVDLVESARGALAGDRGRERGDTGARRSD